MTTHSNVGTRVLILLGGAAAALGACALVLSTGRGAWIGLAVYVAATALATRLGWAWGLGSVFLTSAPVWVWLAGEYSRSSEELAGLLMVVPAAISAVSLATFVVTLLIGHLRRRHQPPGIPSSGTAPR